MVVAYLAMKQRHMFGKVFLLRPPVIALVAREGAGHGSVAVLNQFFNEMPGDVVPRWVGHVTNRAGFTQRKSPRRA